MVNLDNEIFTPDDDDNAFREYLKSEPAGSWTEAINKMKAKIKEIKGSEPKYFINKYNAFVEVVIGKKSMCRAFKDIGLNDKDFNGNKTKALWKFGVITDDQMETICWLIDHIGVYPPFIEVNKADSKKIISQAIKEMKIQKKEGTYKATPWQDIVWKKSQDPMIVLTDQKSLFEFTNE